MKRLLLILFLLWNCNMFALQEPCEPSERFCLGQCRPARECARGGPPPPGLVVPIDANISFLIAAGLGLGIFYFGFRRVKTTGEKSSF